MSDQSGKLPEGRSQIVLYQTEEGSSRIEVRMEAGTVWLSQRLLADLYQVGVNTINDHIKRIYEDRELLPEATIRQYRIVQTEGDRQVARLVEGLYLGPAPLSLPVVFPSGPAPNGELLAMCDVQLGCKGQGFVLVDVLDHPPAVDCNLDP